VPAKPIGIADVATHAQVSVTTVSHVLSANRPVAPATRDRVLAAIEELGYRPNQMARSLRTSRTNTVALVIPDITNPFYPELARGAQDALRPDGLHVLVCNTDANRQEELAFLRDVVAHQVDGVVMAPFRLTEKDFTSVVPASLPVVLLSPTFSPPLGDIVRSDDTRGMHAATKLLIDQGRQRIAFLAGTEGLGPTQRRAEGYQQALVEAGRTVDPAYVVASDFTREGGARGMRQLLALGELPDAVVCVNDLVAIGALAAAVEQGLRVPEQLAVTGFDDIEAASLVAPSLTTVRNPARELGFTCGRLLSERITGAYTGPLREVIVGTELVRRSSA
jgi:LacI family transcriptional regulator